MAILHEGDEVIIPAPFWLSYAEMVRIAGGVPVIIHTKKENGFMMTKEELENAYSAKTKAVVLTTPSNPTGQVMSRADLEMVAEFAVSHDILVVSDEIYEKLIYEDDKQHISIASLGQDIYDRTIVINGVSKSYAMTGWRIGYAAAPLPIAKLMASLQSHMASNPNAIAQAATVVALNGPQDCVAEMCVEFKKRRDYIYEREEAIPGISCTQARRCLLSVCGCFRTVRQGIRGAENRIGGGFRIHSSGKEVCGGCALCRFRHARLYPSFLCNEHGAD